MPHERQKRRQAARKKAYAENPPQYNPSRYGPGRNRARRRLEFSTRWRKRHAR